jgi:hypothetical protein
VPSNWQKYLLEFFAAVTVLLAGGHLAHLFSVEWLETLTAIVTLILSFLVPSAPVTLLPAPNKHPQPAPPPPPGKK